MKDFPNKRDFYYIVGFLIIAIVFVFSGRLADNTLFVDYVGFSGTIVSILLAVIAIIYSFYQSSTYENATHKLDTSANKIEEAATKLSSVSDVERVLKEFKKEVTDIRSGISGLESIVQTVHSGVDSMNRSWESTKKELFKHEKPINKVEFTDTQNFDLEYFKNVRKRG